MSAERWLVVGLGNPEPEYAGTRHNLGADVVRLLAARLGASLTAHKAGVLAADTFTPALRVPVTLAVPLAYMNTSGGPVQQALRFYKVPHERLVVVHDDLDLPLGIVRLKRGGGTAGHNGLKDIERRTGSREFLRVRLGIGRPPGRQDPADYVLRRFPRAEQPDADLARERGADAVIDLVEEGLEAAQNRHHAA